MSDQVFNDCCDFCQRVDDSKHEIEPCDELTKRCKGDTCSTCPPCKAFLPSVEFTEARKLAKVRPKPNGVLTAGKLRQGAF